MNRKSRIPRQLQWSRGWVDNHFGPSSSLAPSLQVTRFDKSQPVNVTETFNREELFRISYVPFVIAELVWDYADSVVLMAAELNIKETREPSRLIRQAREKYKRWQVEMLKKDFTDIEMANAYVYEDATAHITGQFIMNLRADLKRCYPNLTTGTVHLLEATYQCLIMFRALMLYMERQRDRVFKRTGKNMGFMLPKEFLYLKHLIPLYIGDKPVSEQFDALVDQYIKTFANQIALISLDEMIEVIV